MGAINTAMKILVTGGAGYIRIHTCVVVPVAGQSVTVIDNLCESEGLVGRSRVVKHGDNRGDTAQFSDAEISLSGANYT